LSKLRIVVILIQEEQPMQKKGKGSMKIIYGQPGVNLITSIAWGCWSGWGISRCSGNISFG